MDVAGACEQAQASETAVMRGEPSGPLRGVPLTVKSCIDVAGWPCAPQVRCLRKENIPNCDAGGLSRDFAPPEQFCSAARIRRSSSWPTETDNLLAGKTSNPWNDEYSSGGSSGGEAAAIASGCSAGGVGSDGGGSIRVPAHFCRNLRTEADARANSFERTLSGRQQRVRMVGRGRPMARTVSDLKVLFDVLGGPDAGDALTIPVPTFDDTSLRSKM